MRALVTGATGFVGSHLVDLLVRQGATVAALMRAGSDTWRVRHLLPAVERIDADLGSVDGARGAILRFRPDVVFHLAWGGVGGRERGDHRVMKRNLDGTLALFRVASEAGCRVWVGLGSQAEYGPHDHPIDESAATRPVSLYGVVKLCTYRLAREMAEEAGARLCWVRLFSAYGPREAPTFLIPSLVNALLRGEKPPLTAGEQLWDYLYVTDAAEALARLAARGEARGVFNLGSGQVSTVRQLAGRVRDLIDPSRPLGFGERAYAADQVMRLEADITRLRSVTGWGPRVGLAEGLSRTVAWYRREAPRGDAAGTGPLTPAGARGGV